jgi:hypothetical protein
MAKNYRKSTRRNRKATRRNRKASRKTRRMRGGFQGETAAYKSPFVTNMVRY